LDKLDKIARKLQENKGWGPAHVAAALGFTSCLRNDLLVEKLNDQEGELIRTPLLVAIAHDNLASVTTLLDIGVAYDVKDLRENTIFHLAAESSPQCLKVCQSFT
jgi:ankyrin repeat protein